jgi:hypothetical protein
VRNRAQVNDGKGNPLHSFPQLPALSLSRGCGSELPTREDCSSSSEAEVRARPAPVAFWSRCEFGLRVALCHPCGESVNDRQADDEEANAHEDLKAAFLGLKANVPGGGEKKH